MCGVALAPLPWLSMWEMSLEEREDKETWERTKWTWENTDCESGKGEDTGQRTGQWVGDMRDLPYIVTDHAARVGKGRKDNMQKEEEKSDGDNSELCPRAEMIVRVPTWWMRIVVLIYPSISEINIDKTYQS